MKEEGIFQKILENFFVTLTSKYIKQYFSLDKRQNSIVAIKLALTEDVSRHTSFNPYNLSILLDYEALRFCIFNIVL